MKRKELKLSSDNQVTFQKGISGNPNGRPAGIPNKTGQELKALAREHGPEAVSKILKLMRGKTAQTDSLIAKLTEKPIESEEMRDLAARLVTLLEQRKPDNELGAARELLDRGYGKAAQPLTGEDGEGPAKILIERLIIDPKVIEGQVIEQPNGSQLPITAVMRHPAVEEAEPVQLPEGEDKDGSNH